MNNKPNNENQPLTIDDIINEIKQKSSNGEYIYRGERKDYNDVSSALYREYSKYINIDLEGFDLTYGQKEMLKIAKNHIGESPVGPLENFVDVTKTHRAPIFLGLERPFAEIVKEIAEREILTELQHYGGITNLIDFTTDYLIAIYFACSGESEEEGSEVHTLI